MTSDHTVITLTDNTKSMACFNSFQPTTAVSGSKQGRVTGRNHRSRMARVDDRDVPPTAGDFTSDAVRSSLLALGTVFHRRRRTDSDAGIGVMDAHASIESIENSPEMDLSGVRDLQ
jgi:hypothetical protein